MKLETQGHYLVVTHTMYIHVGNHNELILFGSLWSHSVHLSQNYLQLEDDWSKSQKKTPKNGENLGVRDSGNTRDTFDIVMVSHLEAIQCTFFKMDCNSKLAGCRVEQAEIWHLVIDTSQCGYL